MRANGAFDNARTEFESLLEEATVDQMAELYSDIGLAAGKFRWLDDVSVPADKSESEVMGGRIREGQDYFRKAIDLDGAIATNARYSLGVLALIDGEYATAIEHLDDAFLGALERLNRYRSVRVWPRLKVYLAIGLLAGADEDRFEIAADHMSVWDELDTRHRPMWLLTDAVLPVAMASERIRDVLTQTLIALDPQLVDSFREELNSDPESAPVALAHAVTERCGSGNRRPVAEWADLEFLLAYHLGKDDAESARTILDDMEVLTAEHSELSDDFERLVSDSESYYPAWDEEDADFSRAGNLERSAHYELAAAVLESRFHSYMRDENIEQARGLIERVRGYGTSEECVSRMESRFEAVAAQNLERHEEPRDSTAMPSQSILFVGGSEMEARHDSAVQAALKEIRPNISVEFIHTGWSGHWGGYLEEINRKMPDQDAIVVTRYIRTELGKSVRRAAGSASIVWVGCTGSGRQSILRSIINASDLATQSEMGVGVGTAE